jgi:nucleoside-diphosphate-sugar epimerase
MLGRPLKVAQDVDQKNDMIYTKDMANAIVLACFGENLEHRIFHIGTGKGKTYRHLIESVNKIFGGVPIEIVPASATTTSDNYCIFNIERARRELGYSPQYGLEEGVRDYIETMRKLDISPV